eukprot:1178137-Prorocentrum_minimum.AAC.4
MIGGAAPCPVHSSQTLRALSSTELRSRRHGHSRGQSHSGTVVYLGNRCARDPPEVHRPPPHQLLPAPPTAVCAPTLAGEVSPGRGSNPLTPPRPRPRSPAPANNYTRLRLDSGCKGLRSGC